MQINLSKKKKGKDLLSEDYILIEKGDELLVGLVYNSSLVVEVGCEGMEMREIDPNTDYYVFEQGDLDRVLKEM